MFEKKDNGYYFYVKVIPNSQKNEILGWENSYLKVKINAQPEKDKANKCLIEFFSKTFSISKSNIWIISGKTSRIKRLFIEQDKINHPLFD